MENVETAGQVNTTPARTKNVTVKPKSHAPDRSTEENYPALRVGAGPVRNVRLFDINFTGYIQLCFMVKDCVWTRMKTSISSPVTDSDWLRFMLYLLAARIVEVVKSFESEVVDPTDEVLVPGGVPIPRPIFSYLSSIGDVKLTELNLILRPRITLNHARAIVNLAYSLDTAGLGRDALRATKIPEHCASNARDYRNHGRALLLRRLFKVEVSHRACGDGIAANLQSKLLPYLNMQGILSAAPAANDGLRLTTYLDNLVNAATTPPGRLIFTGVNGYNDLSPHLQAAIVNAFRDSTNHLAISFGAVEVDAAAYVRNRRLSVLTDQLTTLDELRRLYRCSATLPTNSTGTAAQLIVVNEGDTNDYTLESCIGFPSSVGAMAFASNFNVTGDHPVNSLGYKSLVVHENVPAQLSQWIVSNLTSK